MGEWEHGTARLEEAATVFCGALKKLHRKQMPSLWAGMQNNYGTVLSRLGEREARSGTVPLKQAVTVFRKALKEETRERAPVGRLGTLNNLGFALCELAKRERGTTRVGNVLATWHEVQAVKVFREALNQRTQAPFEPWAAVQVRLALALHNLGQCWGGETRLEEAVTVFREVLKTGELPPLHRAMAYYNLGTTLYLLGEREGKTSLLEEAVIVFREALNEPEYEQIPEKCEATMRNLNLAQKLLDARQAWIG